MNRLKVIISSIGLFFIQSAFSANCLIDANQMYEQIVEYKSIYTKGCPMNSSGVGIIKITNIGQNNQDCQATCIYARGAGSKGKACTWEKGNWGNTLACH